MKVSLIDFTGKGQENPAEYAAAVLIFTKSTRLEMDPDGFEHFMAMPYEHKLKELNYMANTIPSSWEFVDYTFMVNGVSRAFTHQFVRSRTFSFAQQTMRVLNVSGWNYATGPSIPAQGTCTSILHDVYHDGMAEIDDRYRTLIERGATIEDARGILPTNILTNIVAKCNMRTLVELVRKRSSPRVQGEYRAVLEAMKASVREVHPWIDLFIARDFERAARDLDKEIAAMEDREQADRMLKLVDQMRAQS